MAKLTDVQIAALIVEVWGKPWTSTIIDGVSIVLAESGGNPAAINRANSNGTSDHGLWQINTVHKNKFSMIPAGHRPGTLWSNRYDPLSNTKMAYQIYRGWGRSWKPWSAYNNGSYKQHRARGAKAAAAVQGTNNKSMVDSIIASIKRGMWAGLDPSQGVPGGFPGIENPFADLQRLLKFIADKENWIRLGFILAGGLLLVLALYQILSSMPVVKDAKSAVVKGAKLAVTKGAVK